MSGDMKSWDMGDKRGFILLVFLICFSLETVVFLRPFMIPTLFVSQQEYLENGPLFSELKFYQRAAKQEHSK